MLGSQPEIVRVIFFDKTPDKNWLVTWHQDKTILVNSKSDIAGWGLGLLKMVRTMCNQAWTFLIVW